MLAWGMAGGEVRGVKGILGRGMARTEEQGHERPGEAWTQE